MRFVHDPTPQEQAELERMTRQEIGRVAMRAQMILLSARKYTAPDIADLLATSRVTVYTWLDRFDAEGPAGLYDRPRSVRPPDVDETAQQYLVTALDQTPEDYGYPATIWTTQLLQALLQRRCALHVCADTVRRALHALGYRWRRPRWAIERTDPEAVYRLGRTIHAVQTATPGDGALGPGRNQIQDLAPTTPHVDAQRATGAHSHASG